MVTADRFIFGDGDNMSDIKLFRISETAVCELEGKSMAIEKSLQHLMESNLEALLGVRFLASEYATGKKHKGRIDTLGVDENGCPVIIEYKRAINENVINQGLFYLDWLMDHQAEFTLLVIKKFGKEAADAVEWSNPRLVCIANDFTRYDEHAVQQINRNIELIRYRHYSDGFLLLEMVNAVTMAETSEVDNGKITPKVYKTVSEYLDQAPSDLKDLFEQLKDFLLALGDDVQMKTLKFYFAFKRIKNFACVEVRPQAKSVLAYIKVDPETIQLEEGFSRDVRKIGHFGTGDLELTISSKDDLEKAQPLLLKSYEAS